MPANWKCFLKQFSVIIQHKSGLNNKVTDALSRRTSTSLPPREALLVSMKNEVPAFDFINEFYFKDVEFSEIYQSTVPIIVISDYFLHDGFLFKRNSLCVPQNSLRKDLVK